MGLCGTPASVLLVLTGQYRMPRSKTASKQAEILDAAARVFSARPYHLVLIDDVAEAAHVGKGTIYRYFETKEDLHFAAILYGFDALAGALSEASLRRTGPAERLERIAHEVIAFFRERGDLSKLLMENERRFEARTEELDKRREVLQRLVEECLADGIASGAFPGAKPGGGGDVVPRNIRAAVEFAKSERHAGRACHRDPGDLRSGSGQEMIRQERGFGNRRAVWMAAALLGALACGKAAAPPPPPPAVVEVAPVAAQDIPIVKEWIGSLDGFVNAEIRPEIEGYLLRQDYKEGSFVKRGTVLFEIDPRQSQASLNQVKGDLERNEAALARAKLDVQRFTPLVAQRAVSQQELDNAISAQRQAQANVDAARANVERAQLSRD